METKDQVQLVCTYFAPPVIEEQPEYGKQAVPFIILHDWKGDRRQTYRFAAFLQRSGHAAIIPDLRGHGNSTQVIGQDKPISHERFNRNQMALIIKDIETCKRFLVQKNNSGEVNIDLLAVVAIGEMCPLATEWTLRDWFQFPAYNASGIKQDRTSRHWFWLAHKAAFRLSI